MQIVLEQKSAQGIRLPWVWHNNQWAPASKFEKGLVVWHSFVFWGKYQAGCGEIVVVSQKRQLEFYTQYSFFRSIGRLYYDWKTREPPESEHIFLSSHFPEDQHVPLNAPSDMGASFRVPFEDEKLPLETHPLFLPRVNKSIRHLTQRDVNMSLIRTSYCMGSSMDPQLVYVEQPPLPPDDGELHDILHHQPILVPFMMSPRYHPLPVQSMSGHSVQSTFANLVENSFLSITPEVNDAKIGTNNFSPKALAHSPSTSGIGSNTGEIEKLASVSLVHATLQHEKVNAVTESSPSKTDDTGICDKLSSMTLNQSSASHAPMNYAAAVKTKKAVPVVEPVPLIPTTKLAPVTSSKLSERKRLKPVNSSQLRSQKSDKVRETNVITRRVAEEENKKAPVIERAQQVSANRRSSPKQSGKKEQKQEDVSTYRSQNWAKISERNATSQQVTTCSTLSKQQMTKSSRTPKSKHCTPKTQLSTSCVKSLSSTASTPAKSSDNQHDSSVAPVIVDVIVNKKKSGKQSSATASRPKVTLRGSSVVADDTMSATQVSEEQGTKPVADLVEQQVTCDKRKIKEIHVLKNVKKSGEKKKKNTKNKKKSKTKKSSASKQISDSSSTVEQPPETVSLDVLLCAASCFNRAQEYLPFDGDDSNRRGVLKKRSRSSSIDLESDDEDYARTVARNQTARKPEEDDTGEKVYQLGSRQSRQQERGSLNARRTGSESPGSNRRWKSYERTEKKYRMVRSENNVLKKLQQRMMSKIREYIRRQTVTRRLPHDFPEERLKFCHMEKKLFDYWKTAKEEFGKKSQETVYIEHMKIFKEAIFKCREFFKNRTYQSYNICLYFTLLAMLKELPCYVLAFDAQYLKWRMEKNHFISVLLPYLSMILQEMIQNPTE